jgi:hypothetical protein
MHIIPFRKRECFTGEASQSLPEGIEPPLNMIGLARFFANLLMSPLIKHEAVRFPTVTERQRVHIGIR